MGGVTRHAEKQLIYGLYDKKETLVLTGTAKEIAEFVSCPKTTVYAAVTKNVWLRHKYKVVKLGYETVTEKRCRRCGKMTPLRDLIYRNSHTNGRVHDTLCRICHAEICKAYYDKNKKSPKIYYVYDGDELVFVGSGIEAANFLYVHRNVIYKCAANKDHKLLGRYTIVKNKKGE